MNKESNKLLKKLTETKEIEDKIESLAYKIDLINNPDKAKWGKFECKMDIEVNGPRSATRIYLTKSEALIILETRLLDLKKELENINSHN